VDPLTGGVKSLVHKPSGAELVDQAAGRTLCQTVYSRGGEHVMRGASTEVAADGPVLARLCVRGTVGDVEVTNLITVYADLDQVDFDLRVRKPVTTEEERLCQIFPLLGPDAVLRIETPGAVIRPRPQPEGDLLPGADPRRFAVQGFVDICDDRGIGVTIAPLDSFVLRLDLDRISFEALGNDQNYREVSRDQDGVTSFRFRYALRGYSGGYRQAGSVAWSRAAATPLLRALGLAPEGEAPRPPVVVDARRAIATCLKPADDEAGGIVLRLWETAGEPEPVSLGLPGCRQAVRTDLLERDLEKLGIREGRAELPLPAYGFGAVRLLP
jgi:hypothetical protein